MDSISIVLCSYNGEKYLYDQLNSIYIQSKKPDEVIIIDDNSSDSSVDLIKGFIKKNDLSSWKLICNRVNKGFRLNFIEAIKQAKGDIIFLCDQDDIWMENKINDMSTYLSNNERVMALSSTFEIINGNGDEIVKDISLLNYKENINSKVEVEILKTQEFYSWGSIIGCGMCFRKELVKYMLEDLSEYKYFSHDTYINYIASIIGEVHLLNKTLFKYRIHGENTSIKENKIYGLIERIEEIENHMNFYKRVRSIVDEYKLASLDELQIDSILKLDDKRLKVLKKKNVFKWITLFTEIRNYKLYTRSDLKGIKMYLADLFYMIKG